MDQSLPPSTATRRLSLRLLLTSRAHGLRLAHRTLILFSGTLPLKQVYSGKHTRLSLSKLFSVASRLRGHRDQITCIRFLRPSEKYPSSSNTSLAGFLVTISKDTFLKVWDLATQHCIQTVVAHRSDVWAMDVDPAQELLFTGSGEGEVKAWKINHETLLEGMKETENGEVSTILSI